jgi:dTDP-L-rhamnose 4-epimerase
MDLVTGGCGFIGRHLVTRLCEMGKKVRILDSLAPQIHGPSPDLSWVNRQGIEFIRGSVCNPADCRKAVCGAETVYHLAAETGTGQSMYELRRYADTNVTGTATILEECLKAKVSVFILSSSRAVYGEGLWLCKNCGPIHPELRNGLNSYESWNPICPSCKAETRELLPTSEKETIRPASIYGATKVAQEQLVLLASESGELSSRILRFFNVYGPGQALNNPYTGVLGVFVNKARQGKTLDLYEDGLITRDFVFINDTVDALIKSSINSFNFPLNIGSGKTITISDLAKKIIALSGSPSLTNITGKGRIGDVRGLVADIKKAYSSLTWEPKVSIDDGLGIYVNWALNQEYQDSYEASLTELKRKGLYH